MEFEYDPSKSEINGIKHHIDFEESKALWADEDRIIVPAKSDSEQRYAVIAQLDGHIWIAFYTHRGDSIRIISARRARDKEKQLYDSGRTG
ncbi:MAG: BrnT family toxin [Armatimonadetes bacterium]|nr:BrnT family toxin [Akkermansiaceae bacterium]